MNNSRSICFHRSRNSDFHMQNFNLTIHWLPVVVHQLNTPETKNHDVCTAALAISSVQLFFCSLHLLREARKKAENFISMKNENESLHHRSLARSSQAQKFTDRVRCGEKKMENKFQVRSINNRQIFCLCVNYAAQPTNASYCWRGGSAVKW